MLSERLNNDFLILDGATGTVLQQLGLPPGGQPELLNITEPDLIRSVYRSYLEAGSQIICANTFGANGLKLRGTGHSVDELVAAAVGLAKEAAEGFEASVALDIGPLSELLEPMGSLSFERAYELFREVAEAGEKAGADLVLIETMTDLYEAKAALLAVKEGTALPAFVCMSFDESGRSFTGCTLESMARTLEGLGADAIGINCSIGPDTMASMLAEVSRNTRLPVIAKPNAGLPNPIDGKYDMDAEAFTKALLDCVEAGASIVGGCCGSTPEYIRSLKKALEGRSPAARSYKAAGFICTPTTALSLDKVRVIGERINPTGKKRFQQALLEDDLDYILEVGLEQMDAGADILDVNVGFPGVDEVSMLPRVVKKLQSALPVPLLLDSSNALALEAGLRVYNGKAGVNSVNGSPKVQAEILPLVKKYGASVVGLTLDEGGIPRTAQGRVEIAEGILAAAEAHGIAKEDIWIDCLTLTASAQQEQAVQTLEAVRLVSDKLGLCTVLGVSNISFGLPKRELVTQTFLVQALSMGLSLPIINPNQREMMDAVSAFRLLSGEDKESRAYIARFAGENQPKASDAGKETRLSLDEAIARGLKAEAARLARQMLEEQDELSLVEKHLIPALDKVGEGYEQGKVFLPQLLSAAQAAQSVFEILRGSIARKGRAPMKKGRMIIATVKGDIHDIGKNIVKTILENYGYDVMDLGRDVAPERILEAVLEHKLRLVGLSALMTTTLPAMEDTIRLLHTLPEPPLVCVGGAVVTPEYARLMGADYYAKDAQEAVKIARKVFG